MDILVKLRDLHKQATTERSHHYVASVALEAIQEIERLRAQWIGAVTQLLAKVVENNALLNEATARMDRAGLPKTRSTDS